MNKFLLVAAFGLCTSAFAQVCEVQMVDGRGYSIRSFTAYDFNSGCMEAMKECRKSIRLDYSSNPRYPNGSLDCRRSSYTQPQAPSYPIPSQQRPTYNTALNVGDYVEIVTTGRMAIVSQLRGPRVLVTFVETNISGEVNYQDLRRVSDSTVMRNILSPGQIVLIRTTRRTARIIQVNGPRVFIEYTNGTASGEVNYSDLERLPAHVIADRPFYPGDQVQIMTSGYNATVIEQRGSRVLVQFYGTTGEVNFNDLRLLYSNY